MSSHPDHPSQSLKDASPPAGGSPRSPLAELLLLAGPTIAQMASYTVMQFTDTWMLSRLGTIEPTAAGNGGLFSFAIISLGFGVQLCINTLVSQYYGQKDYERCGSYLWQGIWFGVLYSLVALPTLLVAAPLFTMFGHEPALVQAETVYFQVLVAACALKLTAVALGQFLLAIDRPWIVLWAAMAAMVTNIFVNWLLIYGNWGFPRLGVVGAAWGTNASVAMEILVLLGAVTTPAVRRMFHTLNWRPRLQQLKLLMTIGIPSGIQIVADVLAWGLFVFWVMAQFGTEAMAANSFTFRYLSVSFMPAIGISSAVTALVGRYIGAGRPEVSAHRAHLGFWLTGAYMLTCGVLYIVGRNELMKLFTSDPRVLEMGAVLLIFAGIYQIFDAMYIVYNGALRGAGDTLVPALVTGGLCWGITVVGGFFVARTWPELGPAGPWVAATVYGILLGFYMLGRFVRGRWKSIVLDPGTPSAKVRGSELSPLTGLEPEGL